MRCLDENRVLAFLDGRLPGDKVAEIEAHLAECDACRETVELSARAVMTAAAAGPAPLPLAVRPGPSDGLARGATVGRYVVLGPVGSGAMGEVFAAFDPELNRKVALKLLRARGESAEGSARLLREAQATAKLQHPNVVVVHDAGTIGARVFIAMEFVEGVTVRAWLRDGRRSPREILDVFLAAGRGLAAAHARGLVHRDFKPDNVMVTADGQVRVMDFGLARQLDEGDEPSPEASTETAAAGSRLELKLTQTGAIVGTPAYMAPERFATPKADARADQFSFCVALYEALYGQRPFTGETIVQLMANVAEGALAEAPAKSNVPGWLRRVLLRGLETDPARRFPSMKELLSALEADPTVRRRRVLVGVALAACVVGGAAVVARVSGKTEAMCRGGGARWAAIWDANGAPSGRKDAIHRAFAASGRQDAELAFAGVSRALDAYVGKWVGMYTDACEATQVRGEQSAEVLDLRMSCLQERLNAGSALSDVLAGADATVVDNAVAAAAALPSLERCADVPSLRAVLKPPDDKAARARVDALRKEVARMVATRDAGRCADAEKLAQGLIPRLRDEGYLPLLAEALAAAGYLSDYCTELQTGLARLREGFRAGLASDHREAAARAAIVLGSFLGNRNYQLAEGREWLAIGRALLTRLQDKDLLEAWAITGEGNILLAERHGDQAVQAHERALAIKERRLEKGDLDVIASLNNLGEALTMAGRSSEAVTVLGEARARAERALGPNHARMAQLSINEGEALNGVGRYAEGRAAFERALRIWRAAGASPLYFSYGYTGLGVSLLGAGNPAQAVAPLEEALKIRLQQDDPRLINETRFALARALWSAAPAHARALTLARDARAAYAKLGGQEKAVAEIDAWLAAPSSRL